MVNFKFVIKITVIILLFSSIVKTNSLKEICTDDFSVKYFDNTNVFKEEMTDFTLYRFKNRDQLILSVYIGNFPSLFNCKEKNVDIKSDIINEIPCKIYTWYCHKNTESKEVLFKFSDNGWPIYLHFWYIDLPSQYAEVANDIINSIHSNREKLPPNLDEIVTTEQIQALLFADVVHVYISTIQNECYRELAAEEIQNLKSIIKNSTNLSYVSDKESKTKEFTKGNSIIIKKTNQLEVLIVYVDGCLFVNKKEVHYKQIKRYAGDIRLTIKYLIGDYKLSPPLDIHEFFDN